MNRTLFLLCSLILLNLTTTVQAANIPAASCSSSDVQAAINSARTGDTVIVPSGNCTWTSTVSITNKKLTLVGAGIGATNITDQGSGGAALQVTGASATNFVDVSGLTFIKSAAHVDGMVQIDGSQAEVAFRFHHNRLLQASSGGRGMSVFNVYGLIDHNIIDVTAASGSVQSLSLYGASIGNDGGFTPWTRALSLGTANAIIVEDNTITYNTSDTGTEDAIDAYTGARLVIRHNAINNISIGFHGTDSGNNRSPVSFEIYSNTFTNNSTNKIRGATIRGGTGVIYNNTYGGTVPTGWYGITLMIYRACGGDTSAWQVCNGTNWEIGSTSFSTNASRSCSTTGGVRFLSTNADQACAASGTCPRYFDGAGTGGYPCRDQPGVGPGQLVEPIYAWNNTGGVTLGTYNGGDPGNCGGRGIDNYIQSGRDYVNSGTTPKPGYAAFIYPHPLQSGQSGQSDTVPPIAPLNLRVS